MSNVEVGKELDIQDQTVIKHLKIYEYSKKLDNLVTYKMNLQFASRPDVA